MRIRPRLLAAASLVAGSLCATSAGAQTVAATGAMFPDRIVNGQDLGVSTRPQNLNPDGISFSDCTEDMSLQFSVALSGFSGTNNMQIWASKSSDCTAPLDRGQGIGGNVCWFLGQQLVAPVINTLQTFTFTIRVQDILGEQNASAPVTGYVRQGASACFAQPTFSPIPININFVPLDSGNNMSAGTAFQYVLNTDTVGPPAPGGIGETVGDTLFNDTWTANSDSDTNGYDIFIDPIPGQEGGEASFVAPEPILVCPDTGTSDDGGVDDATADADLDGMTTVATDAMSTMDAACHFLNVGRSGGSVDGSSGVCNDSLLAMSIVQDGGSAVSTVDEDAAFDDEAGEDASSLVEEGSGGISTIPLQNLVNGNNGFGITVADKSADQYTIKGLQNGTTYTVVVASVDAYGNVGPASGEVCDFPAPTQDFWNNYKNDGGGAGGGFCALDAAGAPVPSLAGAAFLVSAVALVRRKRKRGGR